MSLTSSESEGHDGASDAAPRSSPPPISRRAEPQSDEELPTAPRSPHVKQSLSQSQEAMPPPPLPNAMWAQSGRKRSREEATAAAQDRSGNATPVEAKHAPFDSQEDEHKVAPSESSATIVPPTQTESVNHANLQEPSSALQSRSSSRQSSGNAQNSSSFPFKSSGSAKSDASTLSRPDSGRAESENDDDASNSTDGGLPGEAIEPFDWQDLSMQYHDKASKFRAEEQAILKEFSHLGKFFSVWAQIGCSKENDRGFKRLKTQEAFVQKQEQELEAKRQHYVRVVDAFQRALELLAA